MGYWGHIAFDAGAAALCFACVAFVLGRQSYFHKSRVINRHFDPHIYWSTVAGFAIAGVAATLFLFKDFR